MIPSAIPGDGAEDVGRLPITAGRCEVVAAAVLRAARTSTGRTEAGLAVGCAEDEVTIRAWENGSQPLTDVPAPQLEHLKGALLAAGAEPRIVADLDPAAWCDLVVLAIARSDDCTGLLADPLTAEDSFCELLTWALEGHVPTRYKRYVLPGALLRDFTLTERTIAVLDSVRPDLLPRRI